jgi:hypothetical protein
MRHVDLTNSGDVFLNDEFSSCTPTRHLLGSMARNSSRYWVQTAPWPNYELLSCSTLDRLLIFSSTTTEFVVFVPLFWTPRLVLQFSRLCLSLSKCKSACGAHWAKQPPATQTQTHPGSISTAKFIDNIINMSQ